MKKLPKDFYTALHSFSNIDKSSKLYTILNRIVNDYFKSSLVKEIFILESEFDKKLFSKLETKILDFNKENVNLWYSKECKIVRFFNVSDRTTYILYTKDSLIN